MLSDCHFTREEYYVKNVGLWDDRATTPIINALNGIVGLTIELLVTSTVVSNITDEIAHQPEASTLFWMLPKMDFSMHIYLRWKGAELCSWIHSNSPVTSSIQGPTTCLISLKVLPIADFTDDVSASWYHPIERFPIGLCFCCVNNSKNQNMATSARHNSQP